MITEILEAFETKFKRTFRNIEEIRQEYSTVEILDVWLEYEGIVGYTRNIIDLLGECEVYIEE